MESALAHARKYLAASHPEDHREIVAVRYIPPHGDSTVAGYWLVELAPYFLWIAPDGTLTADRLQRSFDP